MRALRSCDFCGGDAAGTFEVVPPELEPTEAEQRRIVLCHDCKDQLEVLLEPLLARAGMETTATAAADRGSDSGAGAGSDSDSDSASPTEPAPARGRESVRSDATRTDSGPGTNSAGTAGGADGTDGATSDARSGSDSDSESGTVVASADESTPNRNRTGNPNATVSSASESANTAASGDSNAGSPKPKGGITFTSDGAQPVAADESDETDAADRDSPDSPSDDEDSTSTPGGDDSSADAASADAESGAADESDSTTETPPSKAYAKVIRLLRNRESPIGRRAAAELAAGAYDLETEEADAIIDYALENDEFVEEGGELRKA